MFHRRDQSGEHRALMRFGFEPGGSARGRVHRHQLQPVDQVGFAECHGRHARTTPPLGRDDEDVGTQVVDVQADVRRRVGGVDDQQRAGFADQRRDLADVGDGSRRGRREGHRDDLRIGRDEIAELPGR